MKKLLLLAISFGIALSSFSMRKKKIIEQINGCSLNYYKNDAVAGLVFVTTLQVQLEDGQEISSTESFSKITFRDFDVTVGGSGKIFFKGRKKLRIVTYYDSYRNPYVTIKVTMKERPDISKEVRIPINFNALYYVHNNGSSGISGKDGCKGSTGYCGRDAYYNNGNGENGGYGNDGEHGRDGENGRNAPNVDVFVEMVDFERDNTQLAKISIENNSGKNRVRYINPMNGSVSIYAVGGDGGNGGDGGRGGSGGRGGDGEKKRTRIDNDGNSCSSGRDAYGGNGGLGGQGGRGGDGGNGGDGGIINVYFKADAWHIKENLHFYVYGGSGGNAGSYGRGGYGGKGASGGRGNGRDGRKGNIGDYGRKGYDGNHGAVNYYNWD